MVGGGAIIRAITQCGFPVLDRDQHVVAIIDIDGGVTVGIGDPDAVADRVVGIDGGVAFRISDTDQPIVVVIGIGGHPAIRIGVAQQVAEQIVVAVTGIVAG